MLIACTQLRRAAIRRAGRWQGGEFATCANCGGLLLRACPSVQHLLALSVSAAVCFVIANVFPVIGITIDGRTVTTTLWGSALSLADHETAPIAIVVALALVIAPAMQIALLCWVLALSPSRDGRRPCSIR